MSARPKILFVGMHNSPHTACWIEMAADLGYDLHLFPVESGPPYYNLKNVTLYVPASDRTPWKKVPGRSAWARAARLIQLSRSDPGDTFRRFTAEALRRLRIKILRRPAATILSTEPPPFDATGSGVQIKHLPDHRVDEEVHRGRVRLGRADESDQTAPQAHGPDVLESLIRELKPELIHSMEFQHSAYLVLAARDRIGIPFPRWLATNWGSDIFYFRHQSDHARQIRRVCESIDLYSCECHRDLALGREFGYRGPDLPVLPSSGSINIDHYLSLRDAAPPSRRKLIMVKGYDHFAGRAMVSLAVLERFAAQLQDYTIVLFSVGARPRARALQLAAAGTLNIKIIGWAPYDDILRHFGKARIYLGISISDAISTSVLEAMAMGAFPIQTDTSCCAEWFVDGKTGFTIPPENFETICARFSAALTDNALVDSAAEANLEIIRSRLTAEVLRPKMRDFYRQALADLK